MPMYSKLRQGGSASTVSLSSPIYLILEHGQLKEYDTLSHGNSLGLPGEGDKHMANADRSIGLPDKQGSRSEYLDHS